MRPLARAGLAVGVVRDRLPFALALATVAAVAGAAVLFVAVEVFPYHTVNDDEAVYLTQAAMLLEGRLWLDPAVPVEAARPWFFVVDGDRLYPKYTPPTAAVFALGLAVDRPRLVLGAIAAASTALVGVLAADAADRPAGLVAAVAFASAPLVVVTGATFLSYAPTTLALLAFATAYVRSYRAAGGRRRLAWGVAAGAAIGWAFFARPYDAVLVGAPFVAHTCWRLWRARPGSRSAAAGTATTDAGLGVRGEWARAVAVAVPGLAFVGVALTYNAVVVGDPLTFPYEAFAPRDGLGFGRRAILGYDVVYTPAMAVEATTAAVRLFVTRWGPLGPLGAALALVGVGVAVAAARRGRAAPARDPARRLTDDELRAVLLAIAPAVVVGQAYFWGTRNGLANGLIDLLGPYYHYPLAVPTAAFAGLGAVALARAARRVARDRVGLSSAEARGLALVALLVTAPAVGALEASLLAEPLDEHRQRTATLAATYEPIVEREFDDAVVFVPTPYGDWLGHPFQALRPDPGGDGPVRYVTDGPPERDLAVLAATNRTPYRFTYRGAWTGAVRPVEPALQRLRVVEGRRVDATTRLGVPAGARSVSLRVESSAGEYARYAARVPSTDGAGEGRNAAGDGSSPARTLGVRWTLSSDGAAIRGYDRAAGPARVPVPDTGTVDLVATFVDAGGASVTYRQTVTVERRGDRVAVVWPPETRVCRLRTDCGREGTWVGPDGDYVDGVSVNATATTPS